MAISSGFLKIITVLLVASVICLGIYQQHLTQQLQASQQLLAAVQDPGANQVSADRLAATLLLDSEAIASYIQNFPIDDYEIAHVPSMGLFYIDSDQDFIKNFLLEGREWEPHVGQMIRFYAKPGTTMIDAGAHIGTHTLTMARAAGINGRVYAFEPQRKIFRELYYNLVLNKATNVIPLRFAVGNQNTIIEMSIPDVVNEGGTPIGTDGDQAELRTIDSFGFSNVSLIKIDVEHFEDPTLDGARETIAANKPVILIEIQGGYNYDSAPAAIRRKVEHTIAKLENQGYTVTRYGIYDYVATPKPPLTWAPED